MNWLQRVMYGRYGGDRLNVFLLALTLVCGLVLRIVQAFTLLWWLPYFSVIPLIFCVYRMFSKNISRRQAENQTFLNIFHKIASPFRKSKTAARSVQPKDKAYRYYHCPKCRIQLRVPKGKGKICITCPKCRTEFIKKA